MDVKGKKSFTLSKLTKLQLLVLRRALNDYYSRYLEADATGEVSLRMLNQLNDHWENLPN